MIHFMVDFENVRNNGLKGCEYLDPYDNITIFYSACCSGIEQVRMEQILSIECGFDVCKINKTWKNAVNFYVASQIGKEFGSGYKGDIAIVSNDTGFSAVQDYWHLEKRHIILGPSVEKCIVSAEKKSFRTSIICKNNTLISIERMHERYQEKQRIRKELKELFNGSTYETLLPVIDNIVQAKPTPKELYLSILKEFGKKDGLEIYSIIKNMQASVGT